MRNLLTYLFLSLAVQLSGASDSILYIERAGIRLGVDLGLGGAITYLSGPGTEGNIINNFDRDRHLQLSFFSEDSGDFQSMVIEYFHGEDSLYLKTISREGPPEQVEGNCVIESFIKIEEEHVDVQCRLLNAGMGQTHHESRELELPAAYVNISYSRLLSYTGMAPYTMDKPEEILRFSENNPDWSRWQATEHWVAFLNEEGIGLGIISPEVQSYVGGFSGKVEDGDTREKAAGYCAPVLQEIVDHNLEYEYGYCLKIGSLKEIRRFAQKKRVKDVEPGYDFVDGREHFFYTRATDQGWPLEGRLKIRPQSRVIQVHSPQFFHKPGSNMTFSISGVFPEALQSARLHCLSPAGEGYIYNLDLLNDNRFHHYRIALGNSPRIPPVLNGFILEFEFKETGGLARILIDQMRFH
ncbi:MAG: hypothetical protein GY790_22040 [Bacteroidetes bacterium]|nr:hypothetical protein [Bacteroidota bacterium]